MASKSKGIKEKKAEARKTVPASRLFQKLNAPTAFSMSELKIMAVIFAAALLIRSIYFFINKSHNPLFYHPNLDALFHHNWARDILKGNYKIGSSSIAFAIYCQHFLGALNTVLVYLLSRQFFPSKISALAGFIAVLYWPLIFFEGDLLVVTLAVFFDLLLLLSLALAVKRASVGFFVLSGILFGLAAITRPSILVLIPIIPLVFYLVRKLPFEEAKDSPDKKQDSSRKILGWKIRSTVVMAGLLVVVVPVLIRNYVIGRDFVPIASQGGVNFYIGNNPQSNGSRAVVPGAPADLTGTYRGAIELAEKETGRPMKPSEVSNYYLKKGLGFIFDSPASAAKLFMKKLYLFWAGVERSNNKYIQFFWRRYGLGRIPLPGFWLVGPLALLGGMLLWRRRRELSLLYLFVVSYMVGVVLFFVNARFRLPVTPVLMIFSAYSLYYLYSALRSKDPGFGKALLVLVLLEFPVNYDFIAFRGVRAIDEAITYHELGNAFMQMGNKAAALNEYEKARGVQEKYPTRAYLTFSDDIDYRLGLLYREKGELSKAIEALKRIGGKDEAAMHARNMLADCYLKKGMLDDAIQTYIEVQKISPDDVQSRIGLAVAYRMKGGTDLLDLSEKILRQILKNTHEYNDRTYLELARTLEKKGDTKEAVEFYLFAAGSTNYRLEAYLELAWLYKKNGETGKVRELVESIRNEFSVNMRLKTELEALLSN
jgi:tetratricopeptide (TPR) repeat protein